MVSVLHNAETKFSIVYVTWLVITNEGQESTQEDGMALYLRW